MTKSNTPPSKRVTTKEKLYKADNELYKDLCQKRWLALFALKEVFGKITDSDDLHDLEEAVILICRKITDLSIPVDNQIKLMRDRYGCECSCADDDSED